MFFTSPPIPLAKGANARLNREFLSAKIKE